MTMQPAGVPCESGGQPILFAGLMSWHLLRHPQCHYIIGTSSSLKSFSGTESLSVRAEFLSRA